MNSETQMLRQKIEAAVINEQQVRNECNRLRAKNELLDKACSYIRFQAECWSNTGDTNSLRQAMRDFVHCIDTARKP